MVNPTNARWNRRILFAILMCFLAPLELAMAQSQNERREYDVVIYGGTSAAVIAAVQCKKMGKSVVIVCPDRHLGGLSSGGLGWTDTGKKEVIGGLARNFYHRIWKEYQNPEAWKFQSAKEYGNKGQGTAAIDGDQRTMWIFEPSVAERVFENYIREFEIPVHRDRWLDRESGVSVNQGRIQSIRMLDGGEFTGTIFIDATYEGDLMAAAGVDFHVGREGKDVYGEQWNGVQTGVLHHRHHFDAIPGKKRIDPYRVPGDPSSGVIPRVSAEPPGEKHSGDHRVQAYCFRMCLTDAPQNRVPFPKPANYDSEEYELLVRIFDAGWRDVFSKFDPIPNHKTDTNNHGPMSTDNIGMNYDYPEASYARRKEIIEEHRTYQQGWLYFIANDPRVPPEVQTKMKRWGLAKDEFVDNDHWPHQIYVREARRMVGHFVMTEHELLQKKPTPEPVGMGSYTIDSHNVQRYITPEGYVQNEGDIGVGCKPYQIAYGALVPRKEQCQNLFCPVCVSSSHIAFGSIRMEPVFMILGQSAATAAAIAIDKGIAVQDVDYQQLRSRLLQDGQVLEYDYYLSGKGVDPRGLEGIVIDDEQAIRQGHWQESQSSSVFLGMSYRHDGDRRDGASTATFSTDLEPGIYEVRLAYTANRNRASNVPVQIQHADGLTTRSINQRLSPPIDGMFVSAGKHRFAGKAVVSVSNEDTDGYVVIDGIQFVAKK